jgi:hypothetical protein
MSQKEPNRAELSAEVNTVVPHLIALAREISESAMLTVCAMFDFFYEALDAEQTDKVFFTAADIVRILALGGAIALAAAAMGALGIASTAAMLLVIPIAGAIAAVAAGAFLIYEHWGAVVNYFKTINWRNVGMDILKGLASGILAGLTYLTGPLGTVAKYIFDYFHGHSPPPLGPLHDLNRLRIVETIAETIKPHPMLQAIRRTAAAAAIAVPMAIAAGGAMPSAAATMRPGASAGAPVINISVVCNFDATASTGFKEDAKKYAYEMVEAMHRELVRRQRTDF